ncbi:cartilage intermediate layer protein 1-like [Mizuhopecten yessoensis]|uniref:cartilage intermediate layer protein 1-like n=1 Tax=Mizuhopecten yessoensis TaxID=6573 RepID=UPI000B45CBA0|nr:cartilage intermediate layer protein 1-like [Mizuhopecten yessoensis]
MEKEQYIVSPGRIGFQSLDESCDSGLADGESTTVVKGGLNTKKLVLIVGSIIAVGVIAAVGVGLGVAILNKDDLPPGTGTTPSPSENDPIDGEWTYWDKWSDCSLTCGGGTQVRRRTCSAPPPLFGGKVCPGKDILTRECSKWNCPDCGRICPNGGTLSKDCDVCLCQQEVLFGTVRDTNNIPLHGVDVYLSYKQWEPVATTNYWGEYRVQSLCVSATKLLFRKEGFLQNETMPVSLNTTHHQAHSFLRKYEKPRITKQPVNKYRFVGQSSTLCCQAKGFPTLMKYSWYKDGKQISQDLSSGTLRLPNLQKMDEGIYSCMAESEAGIVKSESVLVNVKDVSKDTCDKYPVSKKERLPAGCFATVNGVQQNEVDIGQCVQLPCITSTDIDNGTCEEWWPSKCCNVETVDRIEVTCPDFTYSLNKIETCGCSLGTTVTRVTAFAYGIRNGTRVPFQRGKVFVDGGKLTYSSSSGMLSFSIPFEKTEVTLSLQEDIKGEFLDSIKTLKLTPGKMMTVNVILPLRPIPVSFNTRMGLSIPLNNVDGADRVATVSIPSDSMLDKDGNKYEGAANAFVNFMDPRKLEDLQAADGSFTTLDDNGNAAPLETFGMFRMHFEDNSGSELSLSGPITTQMDASLFNISQDKDGNPDLSMWHLDPNTGKWVEQGAFRYVQTQGKRRLLAKTLIEGTIDPSSIPKIDLMYTSVTSKTISRPIYSNCDKNRIIGYTYSRYIQKNPPAPKDDACYVRVRTYTDFTLTDYLKGVTVTAITKELNGPRFKGISTSSTDENGIACVEIFCNSIVYLYTTFGTQMYATDQHSLPDNYPFKNIQNLTQVQFTSIDPYINQPRSDKMYSPAYDFKKKPQCEKPSFSDGLFQFAPIKKENRLETSLRINVLDQRLAWYTRPVEDPLHKSCFIKLNIKSNIHSFDIISKSFIQDDPSQRDEYGTYFTSPYWDETTDRRYSKAACIEFRCSGLVVDGATKTQNVPTLVYIYVASDEGARCTIDSSSVAVNQTGMGNSYVFLANPRDQYGQQYGVFIRNQPADDVRQMCESGTTSGSVSSTMKPDKNPAFQLTCI